MALSGLSESSFFNQIATAILFKKKIRTSSKISHKIYDEKIQTASKPLTCTHDVVEFYFQEAHEPSFLLPLDFVELQDAVNRIPGKVVFLHGFLYGVVFR